VQPSQPTLRTAPRDNNFSVHCWNDTPHTAGDAGIETQVQIPRRSSGRQGEGRKRGAGASKDEVAKGCHGFCLVQAAWPAFGVTTKNGSGPVSVGKPKVSEDFSSFFSCERADVIANHFTHVPS
jgi:hypothetical protein